MTTIEAGIFGAILAEPGEDLHRLAYADWLDDNATSGESPCPTCTPHLHDRSSPLGLGYHPERSPASGRHEGGWTNCKTCNGGGRKMLRPGWVVKEDGRKERAELIRVQCELAYRCTCGHDPIFDYPQGCSVCALRRRERELLRAAQTTGRVIANGLAWSAACEGALGRGRRVLWASATSLEIVAYEDDRSRRELARWSFRRGFVASVTLTLQQFLDHAAALFRAAPIEEVRLSDRRPIHHEHSDLYVWEVYGSDLAGAFLLPEELFRLLPGCNGEAWRWEAATEALAQSALSAACVLYGRRLAGLPDLKEVSR